MDRGQGSYQAMLRRWRSAAFEERSDENAQRFVMCKQDSPAYEPLLPGGEYDIRGAHNRARLCTSDENAQVTIEAILLFGFFITVFLGISFSSAVKVSSSSNDVASVMEAQNNLNKISGAVEAVAAGPRGAVRTVTITSNIANWEINTNAPTDGINPTPQRPILNYEISIWDSNSDVPGQLYRIRSDGDISWGAVTVLDMSGVSTGAALGQRTCSHQGDGKGTWDVRIENAASTSAPYIVFDTANPSADCAASNTTINMYLVG